MKIGDLVFDTWNDGLAIVIEVYEGFGIRLKLLVSGEEYDEWVESEYIEVINEI